MAFASSNRQALLLAVPWTALCNIDANRYKENEARVTLLTFGEMRLDVSKGHIELDNDGGLRIKPLGEPSYRHDYSFERRGFGGDCVYVLQRHFVDRMLDGAPFEVAPEDYLKTVRAMAACYASAATGQVIDLTTWQPER